MLPSASARIRPWPDRSAGRSAVDWCWCDYDRRSTIVDTAVVAVTATSTIGAAMETDAATASDWNDQTVLSLIAPKRHGLSGDRRQADNSRN